MTPQDQKKIAETLRRMQNDSHDYLKHIAEKKSARYLRRVNVTEEHIAKEREIIAGLELLIVEIEDKLST